jgi:hypothetical protein
MAPAAMAPVVLRWRAVALRRGGSGARNGVGGEQRHSDRGLEGVVGRSATAPRHW